MTDELRRSIADQEQRRSQLERMADFGVTMTEVSGVATTYGTGEFSSEAKFNVLFLERPTPSISWEILDPEGMSVPPVAGQWPTVSSGVFAWEVDSRGPDDWYIGATIGSVITGIDTQLINIHWSFRGRAFRNPVP